MATNSKKRKARKEYDRGLTAGLEDRNPSGGIEKPSNAYRQGHRMGGAERRANLRAALGGR